MNTKRVSIAVAVTALGLAIAPGVASAADSQVPCGTPAKQAVYSTVVVPGTAAVTHDEYEWSSVTEVIERQWHQWLVDSAATDAVYETVHHAAVYMTLPVPGQPAWDEQVLETPAYDEQVLQTEAYDEQVLETAAYDEQVLVTAAYDEQVMTSPAVYAIEYKFVQKNGNGPDRWDVDPNWNANINNNSGGYIATGITRQGALISAAVYTTVHHDAVYKTVHHDAVYTTVHHDDVYKTVHHDAVYTTVHHDDVYTTVHHDDVFKTVHHDAVYTTVHHDDVFTTVHHAATPDTTTQVLLYPAWDEQVLVTPATDEVGHWEETWSVDSPGEAWSATGETRTVDGETQLLWAAVSPGEGWTATGAYRTVEDAPAVPDSSEQVLVSAAVPAGPACEKPVTGDGDTVVPEPADPASAVPAAAPLAKPAAVNATTELAFTGSDPTLMWLGLGFLLTGIGVSAGYRKVAQKR
jgi:hypothetical protein